MIIGICGKSGSGKSTLAKKLIESFNGNVVYLDIDKIGHKVLLLNGVKKRLVESFGNDILEDNQINRKKLSKIVFSSKEAMDVLTDITWEYMQMDIDKVISDNTSKVIILDWLLLPRSKYFDMCNLKILLDIPYDIRKKRVIERDQISDEAFALRDSASIQYIKDEFDYVLKSNEDINIEEVKKLL